MAEGELVSYGDFSGGLNLTAGPYLLQENQCQDARNVTALRNGALAKRLGSSNVSIYENGSSTEQITHAHTLFATTGVFDGFIAVGPVSPGEATDSIVKITSAGVTTTLETGLTANTKWEWVQGPLATDETPDQGPYYGMNGEDTPQYWDGSAGSCTNWVASTGTVPSGTPLLIYHLDKFWASGDPAYPGRIWSTGLNSDSTPLPDPCNWDTDFIDDIDPDDGETITGLGKVGPYLLVFKQRKAYVLSDPAGRAYRTLSSSIGCAAHRSIVETEAGTIFFSEDMGFCMTDGSNIRAISENIKPLLDTMSKTYPVALSDITATYYQGSYYASIPYGNSRNTVTLEYQVDTQSWWIHDLAIADFALLDTGTTSKLYGAGEQVAYLDSLFEEGIYTDREVAYDSYWIGPYWTWGAMHLNKRVTQYRIDGEGNWEVDAGTTFGDARERLDYTIWEEGTSDTTPFGAGATGDFAGTGNFAGSPVFTQRRYYTPTDGWGRAWSLKIYDENNGSKLTIYSIAGFLRARKD